MKRHFVWPISLMILTGCTSIFNTEPFVDATRDAQGNVILRDTPRMWRDWQEVIDMYVADERVGKAPPRGKNSWNDHWASMISSNLTRENANKYIDYIVESRRKAGLPDLEG
jgi:hypothetical protein